MDIVIQRVKEARVKVDRKIVGEIEEGLLLLIGFCAADETDLNRAGMEKIALKILNLRCFSDSEGKMNHCLAQINGKILAVSQFTLLGNLKKGNRPSFVNALRPELANDYFKLFCDILRNHSTVEEGVFGADMKVELVNDGPVTFTMNSKEILGPRK
jgi:D-tyrosyl-tRNA(Tyr) deacylase